ncbi:hypothetical protein, partial [Rhodoblastus sp.]|uniref:hypothetical protein n=1 Tax=Rhodoblastus sp. TaxID=1962975 RepID=UPI003F9A2FB4
PGSPGHAFYDRLQKLLREGRFDAFVEQVCKPYYAPRMGAPSLPPGRYFRMHMIGYFEIPWGADSDRSSGRVRLQNHPLWRRPCQHQPTEPKRQPPSKPILARFSSLWN